jgi:tetratricopeptide (TPR) repeat protein
MKRITAVLTIALACASGRIVLGQSVSDVRRMYDSGQYQQAAAAGRPDADPRVAFVAGQSYQKLSQVNEARQAYQQLAGRQDAWGDIGRSAVALLSGDSGGAVNASNQAVANDGGLPEAYFQKGLALSAQQDFNGASTAFQRASDLDPSWAAAHYYAGLAYSKIRRVDLTAQHFQTFLRLAPQAPERPQVESIMKTLSR